MTGVDEVLRLLLGIGLDQKDLTIWQMALRAAVVYCLAVVIVRMAKKRFMGRATAFDMIIAVVLGSILSRVITADAPFLPGLAAAVALVAMHWLFSAIALRWNSFGTLVKGHPRLLIRDGNIEWTEMRKTHMTESDLWEDLREKRIARLDEVKEARLERSGKVSVIKKK